MKQLLTEDQKTKFCDDFVAFFEEEREEKIGIIAANTFLDFFVKQLGKEIYNKGVENSKELISTKLEEIDFQLEELKK